MDCSVAGVTRARVVVIGGGGGGGKYTGGGGGGAAMKLYTNIVPGATYNITVGAGGALHTQDAGNPGGNTTFAGPGQTITGGGGTGGLASQQNSGGSANHASGGTGSGGDVNGTGGAGGPYHYLGYSGWGWSSRCFTIW